MHFLRFRYERNNLLQVALYIFLRNTKLLFLRNPKLIQSPTRRMTLTGKKCSNILTLNKVLQQRFIVRSWRINLSQLTVISLETRSWRNSYHAAEICRVISFDRPLVIPHSTTGHTTTSHESKIPRVRPLLCQKEYWETLISIKELPEI